MNNSKIIINTKSKSYPIFFGNGILSKAGKIIKEKLPATKKVVIIYDKNVPKIFLKKLNKSLKKYSPKIYKITATEKTKNFIYAQKLIERILKHNLSRSDCIISFGGGITGDLSAFVSNLTKRGIKFINIPTTLLAQVDASIGGKTAVNSQQGKNLIGTFYQPDFVLIDISILNNLPRREMICGYGEILKHSLIVKRSFFLWLCKNAKKIINEKNKKITKLAIIQSCKIKSKIVSLDEKEKNLRMILNFGHTFAHGFEGAANFSKRLNHGEAVLLGMITASYLANKIKFLPKKDLSLIEEHYNELKLPMKINKFFKKNKINKIVSFMQKDKKNSNNKISLILIRKIGKVSKPILINFSKNKIRNFLNSLY